MEAQLNEWCAKINELKAKAEKTSAETNIEFRKQVEALRSKQEAVKKRLKQLQNAAEGTWEGLRSKIDSTWTDIKASLDNVASKFK